MFTMLDFHGWILTARPGGGCNACKHTVRTPRFPHEFQRNAHPAICGQALCSDQYRKHDTVPMTCGKNKSSSWGLPEVPGVPHSRFGSRRLALAVLACSFSYPFMCTASSQGAKFIHDDGKCLYCGGFFPPAVKAVAFAVGPCFFGLGRLNFLVTDTWELPEFHCLYFISISYSHHSMKWCRWGTFLAREATVQLVRSW